MKLNCKQFIICCTLAAACSAGAAGRPAPMVNVGKAIGLKQSVSKKYVGNITATDDVDLVPRVSALIWEQRFKDGDVVKKDQVLFVLENTTYLARRDAAKAKLAQCRAEHAFAKSNLKRIKSLFNSKAASESSLEEAIRLEATSRAAIDAAQADLLDAENQLSYTTIRAPFDGKTGKAALTQFNYVTPATGSLVNVVSMAPLHVNFWISSNDFLTMFGSFEELKKHADITIRLADNSVYNEKAQVLFINNRVDKDTDTVMIRGIIKNADLKVMPDSLVTVTLSRKESTEMPAVPVSAVLNDGKKDFVYLVNADNTVSVRQVTTGELQGNLQIISKGLNIGDTVVVRGTQKVFPNIKIVPVAVETEKR